MSVRSKPCANGSPKYTQGPWEVDACGSPVIYGRSPKGRMRIADIRGWGHLTGGGHGALGLPEAEAIAIQEANGHLIAAAPELLEACLAAAVILEAYGLETARVVRAAIAKAEGRGRPNPNDL